MRVHTRPHTHMLQETMLTFFMKYTLIFAMSFVLKMMFATHQLAELFNGPQLSLRTSNAFGVQTGKLRDRQVG